MKQDDISPIIREKAPLILAEIQKAKSILLHCHPSPDPDSVGSALAMKFALEQLGKKATVIKGDSDIPQAFMHFPGADQIIKKNFFEVDLKEFDLFISVDASAVDRISSLRPVIIPDSLMVVNIDHHQTNTNFALINLVESSYPATAQILSDLFSCWKIEMTHDIAANLFIGIYTDTGGLKYRGATTRTFQVAAELVKHVPDFPEVISAMDNSYTPAAIAYQSLALGSVENFLGGKLAIASISNDALRKNNITESDRGGIQVSEILRSVIGWDIDVALVEFDKDKVKAGLRTRDINKYDVSKLALALGGGGHKAAAGANLDMPLAEAKALVVAKAKELYNL